MRDLIVQWLTGIFCTVLAQFLSIDQFVTALQETFQMVFLIAFGCIWGLI